MTFDPRALDLVLGRLAEIRPPKPVPFPEWIEDNIVLIDGALANEPYRFEGAPPLRAIAACLSVEDPSTEICVRKSQQTGASILALAWCLYIADRARASTLYGIPGLDALRTLNSQKLQPLIDAWHKRIGREVILPSTSRSGAGSTTYEKRYAGGFLSLANANAKMDLSMVTPRFGVKDEVSKWQLIDGDTDPENLFFGRFTAFRRLKLYKIFAISTPEVDTGSEDASDDGHCRIDRMFRASDQRYWHCECPSCHAYFVHTFDRLIVNETDPEQSKYACNHCGYEISEAERVVAVRNGHWHSLLPPEQCIGRQPGFHLDAFVSLMMSYGAIAADWLKQRNTESGRKDFWNVVLGLPYRFRGDAVDHMRLFERREDYKPGVIPPGCVLVTVAADVQMRGIYVEVVAWKANRESYVVHADYIDGETTEHDRGAFVGLNDLYNREWPDAYGNRWRHDEFGIDANYHTGAVLTWARAHPGVKALQGRDGWGRPALSIATDVDVDYRGNRIKGGAKLRGVGTWPLKSTLSAYLALTAQAEGSSIVFPVGYCHFHRGLDESYFKQLTSEYLAEEEHRGRRRQIWKPHSGHAANHFLDCRIYNLALVDAYFQSFTPEQWAERAKDRAIPEDLREPDLFSPQPFQTINPPQPVSDPFARLAELNRGV